MGLEICGRFDIAGMSLCESSGVDREQIEENSMP